MARRTRKQIDQGTDARRAVLEDPDLVAAVLARLPGPRLKNVRSMPEQSRPLTRSAARAPGRLPGSVEHGLREEPWCAAGQVNRLFRRLARAGPWAVELGAFRGAPQARAFTAGLGPWLGRNEVAALDLDARGEHQGPACELLLAQPAAASLALACCHEAILPAVARCRGLRALSLFLRDDPLVEEPTSSLRFESEHLRVLSQLQGLQSLSLNNADGPPLELPWIAALGRLTGLTLLHHDGPGVAVPSLQHLHLGTTSTTLDEWESPRLTSVCLEEVGLLKSSGVGAIGQPWQQPPGAVTPRQVSPWLGRLRRLQLLRSHMLFRPALLWEALAGLTHLSVSWRAPWPWADMIAGGDPPPFMADPRFTVHEGELQSRHEAAQGTSVGGLRAAGAPRGLRRLEARLVPASEPYEGSAAHFLASLRALGALQSLQLDLEDATPASLEAVGALGELVRAQGGAASIVTEPPQPPLTMLERIMRG